MTRGTIFDPRLPPRFWDKVVPEPMSGCWLWVGATNPKGYGHSSKRVDGSLTTSTSHRVAYIALVGSIPDGLVLDHKCRTRCCVNPDHLEPVTGTQNTLRGISIHAANARKTHCINGHAFEGDNLITKYRANGNQRRDCRACRKASDAAR